MGGTCAEVVAVLVTPYDLPVRDCQQPLEARGSVRNEAFPSPHVVDEHRAKRSRAARDRWPLRGSSPRDHVPRDNQ